MKLHHHLLKVVALSTTGILIPIGIYLSVSFKPPLEKEEYALLTTPPPVLTIPKARIWHPMSIQCPIQQEKVAALNKKSPAGVTSPVTYQPPPPKPTLVLQSEGQNKVILQGVLTKEGGTVFGWTVVKIERNRVLLQRGKEKKWLSID